MGIVSLVFLPQCTGCINVRKKVTHGHVWAKYLCAVFLGLFSLGSQNVPRNPCLFVFV